MMTEPSPSVVQTTRDTFQRDVFDRSHEVPVVVDFWAAWCQPCRLLAPILEKLAGEARGQFVLVKADTEQMPDVAAAFGVQGIPAVYAVRDGQIVDGFVGLLPEEEIRLFLQRIQPSEAERLVKQAAALAASDPASAESIYRRAAALAPNLASARIGLARLLLDCQRPSDAQTIVDELAQRGYLEPEAEQIQAELHLRLGAQQSGGVDACRAAVAADPANLEKQLELARALAGQQRFDEALTVCLDLVKADRKGVGEKARQMMLDVFQSLGPDSDLVRDYRRKLSLLLY